MKMKRKYKEITKDTIISARLTDDELKNVKQLMENTNMTASEIMRKGFHMLTERFNDAGALSSSCL
jgi:hypothetical protein